MDTVDPDPAGYPDPWVHNPVPHRGDPENSLFDIKVLSGVSEFVGLSNYINVFKDPKIISSISFTVIFVVVSMVFHVVLGVALALILNMKFKGRRFCGRSC